MKKKNLIQNVTKRKHEICFREKLIINVDQCIYGNLILKINPRLHLDMYAFQQPFEKAIGGQGRVLTHAKVFRSFSTKSMEPYMHVY